MRHNTRRMLVTGNGMTQSNLIYSMHTSLQHTIHQSLTLAPTLSTPPSPPTLRPSHAPPCSSHTTIITSLPLTGPTIGIAMRGSPMPAHSRNSFFVVSRSLPFESLLDKILLDACQFSQCVTTSVSGRLPAASKHHVRFLSCSKGRPGRLS